MIPYETHSWSELLTIQVESDGKHDAVNVHDDDFMLGVGITQTGTAAWKGSLLIQTGGRLYVNGFAQAGGGLPIGNYAGFAFVDPTVVPMNPDDIVTSLAPSSSNIGPLTQSEIAAITAEGIDLSQLPVFDLSEPSYWSASGLVLLVLVLCAPASRESSTRSILK